MSTQQNQKPDGAAVGTVMGFCVLALVWVALMWAILGRIASLFEPSIGEIAVFNPNRLASDGLQRTVQVAVANQWGEPISNARCVLSSEVMATPGGSLIIEVRQGGADPAYMVHWAGGMTSGGVSNCGSDVNIVVAKQDLMQLVGATGGFGLRPGAD
jgi:hypothetical protein